MSTVSLEAYPNFPHAFLEWGSWAATMFGWLWSLYYFKATTSVLYVLWMCPECSPCPLSIQRPLFLQNPFYWEAFCSWPKTPFSFFCHPVPLKIQNWELSEDILPTLGTLTIHTVMTLGTLRALESILLSLSPQLQLQTTSVSYYKQPAKNMLKQNKCHFPPRHKQTAWCYRWYHPMYKYGVSGLL